MACGAWSLSLQGACAGGSSAEASKTASSVESAPAEQRSRETLLRQAADARALRDFPRALALLSEAEALGAPRALRAELQLMLGQYTELLGLVPAPSEPHAAAWENEDLRTVALLSAHAALLLGQSEEARARLLSVRGRSDAPLDLLSAEAALLLASRTLLDEGRKEGEAELAALLTRLHQRIEASTELRAPLSVLAGRAAALLRQPELSNDHYNRAEVDFGEAPADALLQLQHMRLRRALLRYRAELFIDKHDHVQAQAVLVDLLQLAPADVEGRLLLARLLGDASFDFARAEELAREVLEDNPHHAGAHFVLGGIALRDMDLRAAREWVRRGLQTNAQELSLLALEAAITFLAEEREAFEDQIERLEALFPDNAQPLRIVAEFAEWEHRYPDMQRLLRKAARLDRSDPHVRSLLGLTLVRAGSDAAGVVELNRAYQLDPYDLRVVNTLELFEGIVPEHYTSVRHGVFRLRYPKQEVELLERYVPELLESAWEQMVERYGYEPQAPIDVELYATPEHFGVRTAGVARVGIQGVCFGRKLATVTPEGSPGNLGMTLWHELGHVFHIGLSDHRVPRYLTEGLAEWETKSQQRGWERELDRELHQVREAGGGFRLSRLGRAFSHARHPQDMAAAYYASSLLAEFIAEDFGEARLVEMLGQMGKPRLAKEVVPDVLGRSWDELDRLWQAHLDEELGFLQEQFVPELVRQPAAEVAQELKALKLAKRQHGGARPAPDERSPRNEEELQLRLGLALLGEGALAEAEKQLAPLAEQFHQARFALARLDLAQSRPEQASSKIEALEEAGVRGASLSLLRARLALTRDDRVGAITALRQALTFEPRSEEVLATLAALLRRPERESTARVKQERAADDAGSVPAEASKEPSVFATTDPATDEELALLRAWARVAEHDPTPHRRLVQVLLERELPDEAARAAERLIWVDLAGMESHRLAALAFSRAGQSQRADFEFDSALLCPGDVLSLAQLGRSWKEELRRRGRPQEAERAFQKVEARLARMSAPP